MQHMAYSKTASITQSLSAQQRAEQDTMLKLVLKLYLMNREQLYLHYMDGLEKLSKWLLDDYTIVDVGSDIKAQAGIYCGKCFTLYGNTRGGSFVICCHNCHSDSNMAYEVGCICRMWNISWAYAIYLLSSAVDEILELRNDLQVLEFMVER